MTCDEFRSFFDAPGSGKLLNMLPSEYVACRNHYFECEGCRKIMRVGADEERKRLSENFKEDPGRATVSMLCGIAAVASLKAQASFDPECK